MSVKLMTSDTIRADLQALALTWPDGIPPEQIDRVNALRGELKRRGEDPNVAASIPTSAVLTAQLPIGQMRQDDLEKELRDLSDRLGKKPDDEVAQNRFADVRFELRRRAKSSPLADAPTTPPPPPTPRALELPPEGAPIMDADATKRLDAAEKKIRDAITTQSTNRITLDEAGRRLAEVTEPKKYSSEEEVNTIADEIHRTDKFKRAPASVCGFTAVCRQSDQTIIVEHETEGEQFATLITRRMTREEVRRFIIMLKAAHDAAGK